MMIQEQIKASVASVRGRTGLCPRYALVLGSGLGDMADEVRDAVRIPFGDIPGFCASTATGHKGELVLGLLCGVPVAVMNGRIHYYEGRSMQEVVYPLRVLHALGADTVILTNAVGAVNRSFAPGDLMAITDHINLSGLNPLIGPNEDALGPRFPNMCGIYTPGMIETASKAAAELDFELKRGVYLYMPGPSYETPAEIRMAERIGADVVGMSTVPEAIAAAHMGMRILGISCIANMAAGITGQPLKHEEVLAAAARIKTRFASLIRRIVEVGI